MVVGEPTLMGGEFGDEDERLITRLENTQFDAANGIDDEDSFNNSPALGSNSPWNNKAPSSQESKSDNPTSQASQWDSGQEGEGTGGWEKREEVTEEVGVRRCMADSLIYMQIHFHKNGGHSFRPVSTCWREERDRGSKESQD